MASKRAASCSLIIASTEQRVLMASDIVDLINMRSSEMVTINRLVDLAEEIAGSRSNATTTSTLQRDSRPEQRQHADQKHDWVGAFHPPPNRTRKDLCMDLRSNEKRRIEGSAVVNQY
jgi:hypothetical protein